MERCHDAVFFHVGEFRIVVQQGAGLTVLTHPQAIEELFRVVHSRKIRLRRIGTFVSRITFFMVDRGYNQEI